jgi:hypothetical protein
MDYSLFYAKLIGFYFVIVAISMLVNRKSLQPFVADVSQNRNLLIFSGFLSLIFGLVVVLTHNVWVLHWPVIITILGWLTVIKGVVRIACTDWAARIMPRFGQTNAYMIVSVVCLVLGVLLLLFGYLII